MSDRVPVEIITEILVRFPISTILRCRCVSKSWHALIDGPKFIQKHINHSIKTNTNNSLLINTNNNISPKAADGNLYTINFDSLDCGPIELQDKSNSPQKHSVTIVGSCNGLLCLYNLNQDILIVNPSTHKHYLAHTVTPFPFGLGPDGTCVHGSGYGFGYDSFTDDYKFVQMVECLTPDNDYWQPEMFLFSVKVNLGVSRKIEYAVRSKNLMGVFFNGALHWIMVRFEAGQDVDGPAMIMAYDLGVDQFREVPKPEFVNNGGGFEMNVGVLGTCFCVFVIYKNAGVDAWVMKDYGVKESWTRLFSATGPQLSCDFVTALGYSNKSGEVLLQLDGKKLVWYDLEKKSVEDVVIPGLENKYFQAVVCLGSLAVPGVNGGMDKQLQQQQQMKEQKKARKKRDDFLSKGFKLKL